jgi:hypothetical protein
MSQTLLAPPLVAVLAQGPAVALQTGLLDPQQSVAVAGSATAFAPVVLNQNGQLDPSLIGLGTTAVAGAALSIGQLVNLYSVGGALTAQPATAGTNPPLTPNTPAGVTGPGPFPAPVQGFATANAVQGGSVSISFTGVFNYIDQFSEFSAGNVGAEVYLRADTTEATGGITLTRPSGPGQLDQTVGTVIGFTSPNIVSVAFSASFNDFSRISGVVAISQGGTGATTAAQALINLGTTQSANTFWAGPVSGVPAAPSFRLLVLTDLPSGVELTSHYQSIRFSAGSITAGTLGGPYAVNFTPAFADNNYTVEVTAVVGEAMSTAPCYVGGVQQTGTGTGVNVWVSNDDSINHTVFVHVIARHD